MWLKWDKYMLLMRRSIVHMSYRIDRSDTYSAQRTASNWGNLMHFRLLKPTKISTLSCALQLRIREDPHIADELCRTLRLRAFI